MAPVLYEVCERGRLAIISLCRPKVKNAINDETYTQLISCLSVAKDDPEVVAVILTGCGPYFTSGADLKEAGQQLKRVEQGARLATIASRPPGLFMKALLRFPKFVVAAVNGPAVGIGVTLLPHCDVVYSTPSATFWTPFFQLALVPEFCSSVTFPKTFGFSVANELLYLGRKLSAKEASQSGFLSEVLEEEGFLTQVKQRLADLLKAPLAAKSTPLFKILMHQPRRRELEEALQDEFRELDSRS
ncbi:unnamed protein product, partial [Chrysoparadoxa australica]